MEVKPVKIFAYSNSPRLGYIVELILQEILGLPWEIVTDKRKIGKCPVINYSDGNIPGSLKISPVPLLFETGIRAQEITVNQWKTLPVFFPTQPDSDIPFDILAASFYLVTRYEEYLDFTPDEFGRFTGSSSLAYMNGFLEIPVIDLWARELAIAMVRKFQTLAFKHNNYKSLLTLDVDEPYAYLGKSLVGNIGGFIRDITSRSGKATMRFGTIAKGEKDPYFVFDYLLETICKNGSETNFFIPVGNQSEYDKNPSWKNEDFRKLITRLAEKYKVGLHPSFKASGSSSELKTEQSRLKSILKREILFSRFHFLRIVMPVSYRNISAAGFTEDYSMGFHDEPGFRAGIARPFLFYDVADDKKTNVRIHPFQVMDVTFKSYKKMNPDAAKEAISNMISQTRKVGGLFVSIWHNTTLLDTRECLEWRELFEFTLLEQQS